MDTGPSRSRIRRLATENDQKEETTIGGEGRSEGGERRVGERGGESVQQKVSRFTVVHINTQNREGSGMKN